MERDEAAGLISKKRRTGYFPNRKGQHGSSSKVVVGTQSVPENFVDDAVYRLYFKGLVSDEIAAAADGGKMTAMAGFGVAICDQSDQLLYELKEPVSQASPDHKGVELRALIRGLSESLDLGIRNVVIYCHDYEIYDNITGRRSPKEKGVQQVLLEKMRRLREKFASSQATMVTRNNIKFAYKLARDAIFTQTSSANVIKATKEEICVICLEETKAECMFSNDKCLHRHCVSCVNQFVEVKLRDGNVPTCLDDGCKLELTLETCSKDLTPKLIELWKHKIKEDSIPAAERIYCPYQNCSTLMSKTEISGSDDRSNNVRACVKCSGLFCIDCKVPSHYGLSCAEYKKLHPEPLVNDLMLKSLAKDQNWRQCVKCQHLIELNEGCNHMTCRCGYQFCYKCGVEWKEGQMTCPTGCQRTDNGDFDDDDEDDDPYADLYADGGLSDSPPIPDYVDYYTL